METHRRGSDGRRRFSTDFKRELERALGKKSLEVEILQVARDELKKRPSYYGVSKR